MSENLKNLLRPRLCDACESAVLEAIKAGQELNFCHCEHNATLAYWRLEDGHIHDCVIMAQTSREEVKSLFAGAAQTVGLQLIQRRSPEDRIN